jgi:hypothetical protein
LLWRVGIGELAHYDLIHHWWRHEDFGELMAVVEIEVLVYFEALDNVHFPPFFELGADGQDEGADVEDWEGLNYSYWVIGFCEFSPQQFLGEQVSMRSHCAFW